VTLKEKIHVTFKPSDIKPKTVASPPEDEVQKDEAVSTKPKKPFVRKPHLTHRPFRNDALQSLRGQLHGEKIKKG